MSYRSLDRIITKLQKGKPMTDPPFKTGDVVRLKSGKSSITVLEVDYYLCSGQHDTPRLKRYQRARKGWYIRFKYTSSLNYQEERGKWRLAEDFVLLHPAKEPEMPSLYQTKEDKPRFGTYLTKTQNGKIVLEMKGKDGDAESFAPSDIEEVLPYTVEIQPMSGGGEHAGLNRNYGFTMGDVAVDDVLIHVSTGKLFQVVRLDTKVKNPRSSKNGFILLPNDSRIRTE